MSDRIPVRCTAAAGVGLTLALLLAVAATRQQARLGSLYLRRGRLQYVAKRMETQRKASVKADAMLRFPSHSQGKAQGRSRQEARRGRGGLRLGPQEGVPPSRPSMPLRLHHHINPYRGCSPSPAQANPDPSRCATPDRQCRFDSGLLTKFRKSCGGSTPPSGMVPQGLTAGKDRHLRTFGRGRDGNLAALLRRRSGLPSRQSVHPCHR